MGKGEVGRKDPERSFCEIRAPKKRGERTDPTMPHTPKLPHPRKQLALPPSLGRGVSGQAGVSISRMLPSPTPLAPGRKVHGCGIDSRPSDTHVTAQKGCVHSCPSGPCSADRLLRG